MIPQISKDAQAILADISNIIPVIMHDGGKKLYILCDSLDEGLEEFIRTGNPGHRCGNYHTMPAEDEAELASQWRRQGLKVTYCSQQIEYMHRQATITYMQASEPAAETRISIIPWFILPGRPYPVFLYAYAIWHYNETGQKSQRESAAAAGRVFGASRMNKSTVCRSIKAMEHLFGASAPCEPPVGGGRETAFAKDMYSIVPEILRKGIAPEALAEMFGARAKRLPSSEVRANAASAAFGGIPHEYANVVKASGGGGGRKHADRRKRPARPRKRRHAQRTLAYVGSAQAERIRTAFIVICRGLVLDAAVKYHRFLL